MLMEGLQRLMGTVGDRIGKHRLLRLASIYPPFLGAGIRVRRATPGLTEIDVELPLTPLNRNYVGTQFGGSLFAMCDPFYMLMLIERLGPDYVVWDKSGNVRFRRPGRGTVHAHFRLPDARVDEIRAAADAHGKTEPVFTVEVRDAASGELIAEVEKLIHVRRKDARRATKD